MLPRKMRTSKGGLILELNSMKALSYEELRALYKKILHSQDISKATINTSYVDTFYIWRKGGKELFWSAVTATDFENEARNAKVPPVVKTRISD